MPDTSPESTAVQQRGKDMQSTRQTPAPSERLKQIFMVICGAFFLLLYAVLSVYNSAFSCFKAYIVLPLALVVICALYFLYRLLCRSTDFLEKNLRAIGKDEKWLENTLKNQNLPSAENMILITASRDGEIHAYQKNVVPPDENFFL